MMIRRWRRLLGVAITLDLRGAQSLVFKMAMFGAMKRIIADFSSLLRSSRSFDTRRRLFDNELTSLPEGIFENVTALENL